MASRKSVRRRMDTSIVVEEAKNFGFTAPMALPKNEQFISPNEAARILNITGEAIKQWIYRRRLPAVKLSNGYWKIRIKDLENFIKARQDLRQRRVLIVDQAGEASLDLAKAVDSLGHESVLAHNYSDALLKAADLLPSLFVISLTGNSTEAWKLIEKVRHHRNLRRLPILVISDTELKGKENDNALELGVQGLLKLPITTMPFQEEVIKLLTRAR